MVGGRRTKPRVTEKVRRRLLALANRLVFAMPPMPEAGLSSPPDRPASPGRGSTTFRALRNGHGERQAIRSRDGTSAMT